MAFSIALTALLGTWAGILHAKRITGKFGITALILLLAPATPARAGVILLYHHVDESTPALTSIKPTQFERHLEIIEQQGFTVMPLEQLVERATSNEDASSDKIVAITFDDAYRSIYTQAFPRLKARGWPFTIFVAPAYIANNKRLYLSWTELQEMADNGASIQNHTLSHEHLIRAQPGESHDAWLKRVSNEITGAAQILAAHGFETTQFAYPYGEYNPELLEKVGELGLTGFGQQSGAVGPNSDHRLLPRYPLSGIYVGEAAFRDKLRSLPMPVQFPAVDPLIGDNLRPSLTLQFIQASPSSRMNCFGPGGLMDLKVSGPSSVVATPADNLPVGRSRYNCTYPEGNRYYWFSQLWIRKKVDGSWYHEP